MPKPTKPEADLLELMRADRVVQNRRAAREAALDSADDVSGKAKAAKAASAETLRETRLAAGPPRSHSPHLDPKARIDLFLIADLNE
jgi:hypothetical protein